MRRGEVWIADLPPPTKRRPVLLLMRDDLYAQRSQVLVAVVTTRIRGLWSEVRLGPGDGLVRESVINLSTLATVPKARLERHVTTLASRRMAEVDRALGWVLDINPDNLR